MVMIGDFNYHINWEEMEGERKEDPACFLHTCKNSCCRSSHLQLTCSHSPSPLLYSPDSTIYAFPHISVSARLLDPLHRFVSFAFLFQFTVLSSSSGCGCRGRRIASAVTCYVWIRRRA